MPHRKIDLKPRKERNLNVFTHSASAFVFIKHVQRVKHTRKPEYFIISVLLLPPNARFAEQIYMH